VGFLDSNQTAPETLADLHQRLGGVPLERIRCQPAPGTATETVEGGEVLPGFSLPIREWFERAERGRGRD
jgi:hypothetical protein